MVRLAFDGLARGRDVDACDGAVSRLEAFRMMALLFMSPRHHRATDQLLGILGFNQAT